MHRNNFHLLRLVLALLVMLSHGNHIFATQLEGVIFRSAEVAVNGFFILSGFLISWSIDRSFEWRSYAIKRFARIYPLYFVVILVQVVILFVFNSAPLNWDEPIEYLLASLSTLTFLKPSFGDMVQGHINGSLWTIKIEIMFYIALPIYVWFCKRFGWWWILSTWTVAFIYRFTMDDVSLQWARQLPGSMTFFIAGYVLCHYGAHIIAFFKAHSIRLPGLLVGLIVLESLLPSDYGFQLIYLFALMAALYFIAFYVPPIMLRYDISYGVYLMHVPLFLTIVHLKWFDEPLIGFIVGTIMVIMLSLMATITVEEPMIRWGKRKAREVVNAPNRTKL